MKALNKKFLTVLFLVLSLIYVPTSFANEYLSETKEINFTSELIELAKKLEHNPIKIYNWVYNNIEYENYQLSRKNAQSVYWTKRGNEWDQSTLLITLFRISGIQSKYTIFKDHISPLSNRNVIVDALLPIQNYRGNSVSSSKIWTSLAPWKKDYKIVEGIDLFPNKDIPSELKIDFDDYISSIKQQSTVELFEEKIQNYLTINYPSKTLKDVGSKKLIKKNSLSILPLSLPKGVISKKEKTSYSQIPSDYKVKVTYFLKRNNPSKEIVLKHIFYLPEIATSRITVDFLPNSLSDKNKIKPYGLITKTPANIANVKAVIKIDGQIVANSTSFKTGETFIDAQKTASNEIIDRKPKEVGTTLSLGFDTLNISEKQIEKLKLELNEIPTSVLNDDNTKEEYLGRYIYILNSEFRLRKYNAVTKTTNYLNAERIYYDTSVSPTRVYTFFKNLENSINEKYLLHSSMEIDASGFEGGIRKIKTDKYLSWNDDFSKFCRNIYSYTVSFDEGKIFEDWQSTPGASTIKTFMVAKEQGFPIYTLTKDDVINGKLNLLEGQYINKHDSGFIQNIINHLVNKDATVIVPGTKILYEGLTLTGYISFSKTFDSYLFNSNEGGASNNVAIAFPTKQESIQIDQQEYTQELTDSETSINSNTNENTVAVTETNENVNREISPDGDPIDMLTGEFYQVEKTDISLKSTNKNILALKRTYKSQLHYNGIFGYGWAWNHMDKIVHLENNSFLYIDERARFSKIEEYSNGSFSYPKGANYTIEKIGENYKVNNFDGTSKLFNKNGLLLEKSDRNFNKIIFQYNEKHNIFKIRDNHGRELVFNYNSNGKVISVTDNTGRVINYSYDENDLISFTDLLGNTTKYEYLKNQENSAKNHNMSKYILPNGDYLKISYYKNDQVSHHTNKDGNTFNFQYSRYNKYSETWNEAGFYRKVFFNDNGDVVRIDKKDGTIELKEYDENHNMISFTDGNGFKTRYSYDNKRNLVNKTNAKGGNWNWEYHSAYNKIIKKTDPYNNVTLYEYDERGNLTKEIDPYLNETIFINDQFGNQIKILDAYNNFIEREYDSTGTNLVRLTDKNGNTTVYDYDEIGNQTYITNPKGGIKEFEYNHNNQIVKKIDELDNTTIFEYNENRKLFKKTLANKAIYKYEYSVAKDIVTGNLLSKIINPYENEKTFIYDKLGNKVKEVDYKGNSTKYTYNELNKVSSKTDSNGNITYYTYDGLGNITEEKSSKFVDDEYVDVITKYTYDKAGYLKSKTLPNGLVYNFKYFKNGLLEEEKYTFGNTTYIKEYNYNKLNKLSRVFESDGDNLQRETIIEYDKLQRKIKEINPNGIITTFYYDANSNLLEKYVSNMLVEKYTYNKLNKIASKIDANGNVTKYAYNKKGQLISKIDALNNSYLYSYDKLGNLEEEILPTGHSKKYKYNLLGKLEKSTDQENHSRYFDYDENSNLIKTTDARGNSTSYIYDSLNQLVSTIDPNNNYSTKSYDEFGNITSEVNEEGNTIEYKYDINSNLIEKRIVLSYSEVLKTIYSYDKLNRLVSILDPKENLTLYEYNIFNELVSVSDALENKISYLYDKMGRKIKEIDAKGISTNFVYNDFSRLINTYQAASTESEVKIEYTYDNLGNLLSEKRGSIVTSYMYDKLNRIINKKVDNKLTLSQTYDKLGNIASLTDGNNNTTIYEYNGNNKLVKQIDGKGNSFIFNYDQNNNLISQTTSEGLHILREYDNLNRLITESLNGAKSEYVYDKASRVVLEINHNGIITENVYDSIGRLVSKVEAKNTKELKKTSYKYDKNSNIVEILDANKNITSLEYDKLNRKIKHIYPTGVYQEFSYDKNSNLKTTIKEDKNKIENFYDSLNRLIKVEVNGRIEQEYVYDSLSRLVLARDHNQNQKLNSLQLEYDSFNNILKSTQNARVVNSTYDLNSNLINLSANSYEILNSYDKVNSLTSISLNNHEIANFEYDKDNRLVKTNLSNGISLDINYDLRSREESRNYKQNTKTIYSQNTKYDLNSNVIQEDIVNTNQSIIKTYEYDSLDRLTKDSYKNHNYKYDKLGNQVYTTQNDFQETRKVNGTNEYIDITSTDIEYDEVGNVKSYKNKKFVYDYLNRLIEVKNGSQTIARYTYDVLNRRVSKELLNENKTITYIYHKNRVIQEYENDSLTNSYAYSEYIDDPIAYIYNGNTYYYLKDRQYSIQAITDSLGNIVESYSYNSFGIMTMKNSSSNVILKSNVNNTITYTGRRYDSESGLYYYRNRMYSPNLGRFISKDPKGYIDGMNLYAYVKNNPLKYLDAFGTTAVKRFDGGYVSYSISGRTDDYSVNYDNGSGFGNSGDTDFSHDDVGQFTTKNNLAGMTTANWDSGNYTEYNNGISVFKDNAISTIMIENRNAVDRSVNEFRPNMTSVMNDTIYGGQTTYERQKNAYDMFDKVSVGADIVAEGATALKFKKVAIVASIISVGATTMKHLVAPEKKLNTKILNDYIPYPYKATELN
ncbi:hypothetical protein CRV02_12825 [Arcobacter sp. CECT 8989]|uniref:RHS repeat-associated core domain-containing protein n=1 Tax=Arcobacter sp. CECT 8989 TaxID=2044509 RepID=UPI00100AF8D3|nr:RHS repeat-associated core domain-containing protein [Arcobacter sp. CECT 8989]RXJ98929.1 hypothetical protein CRV02_12825 [Arcobacter sp. CECT 8989]